LLLLIGLSPVVTWLRPSARRFTHGRGISSDSSVHIGAVTLQPAQHTVQLDVKSPDVKVDNHVDVQPAAVQMDAPVVEAHVHVPQQPAPNVVVETAPAPAVVDMRIVSMPARETTSRIERDTVTERITRSVQIEKDQS